MIVWYNRRRKPTTMVRKINIKKERKKGNWKEQSPEAICNVGGKQENDENVGSCQIEGPT